jgi:hypothetical protein
MSVLPNFLIIVASTQEGGMKKGKVVQEKITKLRNLDLKKSAWYSIACCKFPCLVHFL